MYLLTEAGHNEWQTATDKAGLIALLRQQSAATVIIDYTLFDFDSVDEMLILSERFPQSHWMLFSEDLSADFLRQVLSSSSRFSVIMKDSAMGEIREALGYLLSGRRFISQHAANILLQSAPHEAEETDVLTKTEKEILIDIAHGLTTKEIAEKRFSSFHTINTHRKNIFRKLGVNNMREATKYALRAGLVDAAEYYI